MLSRCRSVLAVLGRPYRLVLVLGLGVLAGLVALGPLLSRPPAEAQSTSPLTIQPQNNRVGINTTTPAYTLDVSGTVNASFFRGDGSQLTNLPGGGGGGQWTLSGTNIYNNNAGNVGIGTTTPAYKLDVTGTVNLNGNVTIGPGATGSGLTLAADPTAALQAATRQYADSKVAKSGDAMTGLLTLSSDPTAALHAATKQYVDAAAGGGGAVGPWAHVGQDSKNNTTTPTTKFDLKADVVVLRNATNGVAVRYNPGTITNDVTVAGPAANGRDQSAAFSASSWIHFYWVWNGTTLATLASAKAPMDANGSGLNGVGPTPPTGYTHVAYAGAVRFNASSQLLRTRIKGNTAYYEAAVNILNAGGATTQTQITQATIDAAAPPNTQAMILDAYGRITDQGDLYSMGPSLESDATLRYVSGSVFWRARVAAVATGMISGSASGGVGSTVALPGNVLYYQWVDQAGPTYFGATRALSIDVMGYVLPNAGA